MFRLLRIHNAPRSTRSPVTFQTLAIQLLTRTMADVRFIDVGVNLTDPVFRGLYHGQQKHENDMAAMLGRAKSAGVQSMIITGTSLAESKRALKLASDLDFYATVGCHPTRSKEFNTHPKGPTAYFAELDSLISKNLQGKGRVVAVGECGLDYDRTHFSPIPVQKKYFRMQLALAKTHHLPLFLHSRAAHADFVKILREEGFGEDGGRAAGGKGGVIHSFTGTAEQANELAEMGFHFSVNGCSLKTEQNVGAAQVIPLDRLMLETDAPWCSMRPSHASNDYLDSMPTKLRTAYIPRPTRNFTEGSPVLGRNEPAAVGGVAWVMHLLLDVTLKELTEKAWKNTVDVFGLAELEEGTSNPGTSSSANP